MSQEATLTVAGLKLGVERCYFDQRIQRTFYELVCRFFEAVKTWQYQYAVENSRNYQSSLETVQLRVDSVVRCCPNSNWIFINDVIRLRVTEVTVYKVY